jgi:minor histocompatibility antigen H13
MLGLGDIIIPGLFSSLCLRCDLITAFVLGKEKAIKDGVKNDTGVLAKYIEKEMTQYYFNQSLIGYFLGMTVTYGALSVYQTAQPALLYILPTMLIVYLGAAYIKREFIKMISYDED